MQTYRVAVWATGGVGRFAIRTVVDRPNLELVGAWVHSAQKDGEDVGILAGIAPIGVRATRHESDVLDGDADCVVYAAPAGSRPKERSAAGLPGWIESPGVLMGLGSRGDDGRRRTRCAARRHPRRV